ncbi:7-carboxy-7-deazaguanine synthase QueE [uncultured Erythrobacter sp.]|uniref:7-carboxy-7-deazaguanine synthase QueE n=1 Tax=uncultured Erythrobacter sp. TaxID=263913 RepID=UPI002627EF40|nr:7-carboxy-7-deazaguanine synthase QueE [uncultured Erythrobacter sp.]
MALILATDDHGEPEIFAALQGEGASTGKPVAFIRTSRCNLACTWCDTPYTWHFDDDERPHRGGVTYARKANQVSLEVWDAASRIAELGQERLVITGGEPMLQAGALSEMLEHLSDISPGMNIEIETNGTVKPPARLDIRIDQFNVSPKLAHSGNAAELALIPDRLDHFAADPRAYFKFVIAAREDVGEVLDLIATYRLNKERVFLMAEGTSSEILRDRQQWLAPVCLENGLRMSDRLHIHLYGDMRAT